jgi:alkylation response protein AidB-like acyl-CoA dehydrogenase
VTAPATTPAPAIDDQPEPTGEQFRQQIRAFLEQQQATGSFRAHADCWMSSHSASFSAELGRRGWIGLTWPREYGGRGWCERSRLVLNEELLAAGAPVAAHWFADRQIGPALLRTGTEEQRRTYLPAMAAGSCFFAIGMSEPDSGSDLASVRTTATRVEGGWRVTGTKVWTSHAHEAHHLLALVRTSPLKDGKRHDGLSQLIIALDTPGVTVRPIVSLDGSVHFNEVVLNDAVVPDAALLGAEGSGWRQVTAELANERSGPERFLSTAPLLFELIRRRQPTLDPEIGMVLAELQTLRGMTQAVTAALERGDSPVLQAALVKDLGTRFESSVVDAVRRLAPVEPDLASTDPLSRLLAEAVLHGPDATLRGGTNEILRGIIAKDLVSR